MSRARRFRRSTCSMRAVALPERGPGRPLSWLRRAPFGRDPRLFGCRPVVDGDPRRRRRAVSPQSMSVEIQAHSVDPARDLPRAPDLPRVDVLGVPLALTDYEGAMDWMDAMIGGGHRGCVSAAAVHLVMVAHEDEQTRDAILPMMVVPDGQPLVWALRALGHCEASRVYGPDLMAAYCRRSA